MTDLDFEDFMSRAMELQRTGGGDIEQYLATGRKVFETEKRRGSIADDTSFEAFIKSVE